MNYSFGLLLPKEVNYLFDKTNLHHIKIYNDFELFKNSLHNKKIILELYQFYTVDQTLLDKLNYCDLLIVHSNELVDKYVNFIKNAPSEKIIASINGVLNFPTKIKTVSNIEWITSTAEFYKNKVPHLIKQLDFLNTKEYYFDFLPGRIIPHRQYILDKIQNSQIKNKILCPVDLGQKHIDPEIFLEKFDLIEERLNYRSDNFANYKFSQGLSSSVVNYYGQTLNLSQIIPIQVYNNSCFSIIAETSYANDMSFFTEKTAKPLLSSRLFVVISGYKFLHNLRSLGYKTFEGIIDESYDLIEDPYKRWDKAFEQIEYLCNQKQEEILELALPILMHNFRMVSNYNHSSDLQHLIEDNFLLLDKKNLKT